MSTKRAKLVRVREVRELEMLLNTNDTDEQIVAHIKDLDSSCFDVMNSKFTDIKVEDV